MRRELTPPSPSRAARRLWVPAAFLLLAYGSARPIWNPDVFWHLSIGSRILAQRAVPAADFLSFTHRGERYVDTEWLYEALCAAVAGRAGLAGLIALKAALMLAAALLVDALLRRRGASAPARGAALALLAAGLAPNNDVRPENFSLVFFSAEMLALESLTSLPVAVAAFAAAFALWAALHGGFVLGLVLEALFFLASLRDRESTEAPRFFAAVLAASAAGALIGPFGGGVYAVILEHLPRSGMLRRSLLEWMWADPRNPLNWPLYAGVALAAAAVLGPGRGRVSLARRLALAVFALASFRHRRLLPFFLLASAAYATPAFELSAPDWRAPAAAFAAAGLFLGFGAAPIRPGFPERAADYLRAEEPALGALRLYNPWGWGGYLGWRLFPSYPVLQYGTYLFYDELADEEASTRRPGLWQDFLDRRRLDLALLRRRQTDLRVGRILEGGKTELETRPYYIFFMPQDRWALVAWDDDALIFVRRSAVARAWLDAHEYRALHPGDAPATARALSSGAAPRPLLAAEACRHQAESGADPEAESLRRLAAPDAPDCGPSSR